MFTGIVEAKALVTHQNKKDGIVSLHFERPEKWEFKVGQSIAVDGVCLSVVAFDDSSFSVELVDETLTKSKFGKFVPVTVNLERAMLPTDRFEGHIVQGHVDATGEVAAVAIRDGSHELTIAYDNTYSALVVPKGSIAIDGVSLTVVNATKGTLSVALIPHTIQETTLGLLETGSVVNLEFDIIGKYLMNRM